ncbi:hypothetical protein [Pyruvatibacter mobilis]|uniref:hypothetical protein n=1 Tax=Pyruvatibacter mobilis TaxID=1712261 RepID=UPI003C7ADA9D
MMTVDEIFADDRRNNPPAERSLPWQETQGVITVVVEPKPHWAEDVRAFRLDAREYCRYADWRAHGARSRFYGHIDTCGDDVMMKARSMIAREIADGLWEM